MKCVDNLHRVSNTNSTWMMRAKLIAFCWIVLLVINFQRSASAIDWSSIRHTFTLLYLFFFLSMVFHHYRELKIEFFIIQSKSPNKVAANIAITAKSDISRSSDDFLILRRLLWWTQFDHAKKKKKRRRFYLSISSY